MARLKQLTPRMATLAPRLTGGVGSATGDRAQSERERLKLRDQSVAWRGWYKTTRWQKLRLEVLLRDGYVCQQTKVLCVGRYPAGNSPVVDHIVPHRGNPDLFWDMDNLQTVSKAFHDSTKQSQEAAQRQHAGVWY